MISCHFRNCLGFRESCGINVKIIEAWDNIFTGQSSSNSIDEEHLDSDLGQGSIVWTRTSNTFGILCNETMFYSKEIVWVTQLTSDLNPRKFKFHFEYETRSFLVEFVACPSELWLKSNHSFSTIDVYIYTPKEPSLRLSYKQYTHPIKIVKRPSSKFNITIRHR